MKQKILEQREKETRTDKSQQVCSLWLIWRSLFTKAVERESLFLCPLSRCRKINSNYASCFSFNLASWKEIWGQRRGWGENQKEEVKYALVSSFGCVFWNSLGSVSESGTEGGGESTCFRENTGGGGRTHSVSRWITPAACNSWREKNTPVPKGASLFQSSKRKIRYFVCICIACLVYKREGICLKATPCEWEL